MFSGSEGHREFGEEKICRLEGNPYQLKNADPDFLQSGEAPPAGHACTHPSLLPPAGLRSLLSLSVDLENIPSAAAR